ncbi:hypothetical protein K431DRAFT_314864 [Polychaeton citri CBS 116435]|uniref:Uncharacterized protein n=1 Tax=Polychaeton citri CBS 116435 TaxID=1314669 RepID=A0A9P4Q308_9PEZI|nr:hypothetical protein K431DRAFT_314864 [Polychaeton citri CBS 116435]
MKPIRRLADKYRNERDEAYKKADELFLEAAELQQKLGEAKKDIEQLRGSEAKLIESEQDALSRESELLKTIASLRKCKSSVLLQEQSKLDAATANSFTYQTVYSKAIEAEKKLVNDKSKLRRRNATLESEIAELKRKEGQLAANAVSFKRQIQAQKKSYRESQRLVVEKPYRVEQPKRVFEDDDEDVLPLSIRTKIEKKDQTQKINDRVKPSEVNPTKLNSAVASRFLGIQLGKQFTNSEPAQPDQYGLKSTISPAEPSPKRPKLDNTANKKPSSISDITTDEEAGDFNSFTYQAIIDYTGDYISSFEPDSLPCALTDIVKRLTDEWEDEFGYGWHLQLMHTTSKAKSKSAPCLNTRLHKRKSTWRPGDEDRRWACHSCVGAGLPCFIWAGEEFWMLPVHVSDRRKPVVEGLEVRYWIDEAAAGIV